MSLSTLSEYILPVLGDRAEMAHSLECRTPFLDNKILEFATRLPPEFLLDLEKLREKHIVHEAFKSTLPAFMSTQHKHPFSSDNWYAMSTQSTRGNALFEHYLSDDRLKQSGTFNMTYLTTLKRLWRSLPAHSPMLKKLQSTMGTVLCSEIMQEKLIKRSAQRPDRIKVVDYSAKVIAASNRAGFAA
jgi:asparagine synthase (glutamine-hydrolysing)